MKIKTTLVSILVTVQAMSFLGCGEKDVVSPQSHVGVGQTTQLGTNDLTHGSEELSTNGFAQTLKELDADFLTITNYVYSEWVGARDAALRMRDKIMSLPPEIGKEYAQKMLDRILSIPVNHLGLYERMHAIDSI